MPVDMCTRGTAAQGAGGDFCREFSNNVMGCVSHRTQTRNPRKPVSSPLIIR